MRGLFGSDHAGRQKVEALHALGASVMMADEGLNITYMNPAAMALMQEAEADLQRELPGFSVAKLVGCNIDVFHKTPSHQRTMLSVLQAPHSAMISIGSRTFDLVVTPLLDQGRRVGFVVEWTDARERLLNLDYAIRNAAIDRSLSVVELSVDGSIISANANFLTALGYSAADVVGRHHRMLVDPSDHEAPAYTAFWEQLRAGKFQAGQFKRIGKAGKQIWIEGTYSPILDSRGKVLKVVKFATDITLQVNLLANLKTLIDRNFGEIDGAISMSTSEARSASLAAGEMSANVQAVAAGAEELAASAAEISRNMDTSRTSTEKMFQQAVSVGRSTEALTKAAGAMTGIVGLIRSVASQINLLALNATIEAARAGEAGRGFAVVASEVKNLAIQAARATEQISAEIDGIQTTSNEVAGALDAIREAVTSVREQVAQTASVVSEQSGVTQSMSATMQSAFGAVSTVSANINEISAAVLQASQAMSKTKEAAQVLVR
jgi:PAS domain S-box-containing protein